MHRSCGFFEATAAVLAITFAPAWATEDHKQDPQAVTRAAIGPTSDHDEEPAQPAASETDLAPRPSTATQADRALSPFAQTMRQIIEAEKRSLTELQQRFDMATDERAALAIQRQIEQVKASTEISLLRAQADFARQQGRVQVAEQIEASIQEALHPSLPHVPVDRPVPEVTRGEPKH